MNSQQLDGQKLTLACYLFIQYNRYVFIQQCQFLILYKRLFLQLFSVFIKSDFPQQKAYMIINYFLTALFIVAPLLTNSQQSIVKQGFVNQTSTHLVNQPAPVPQPEQIPQIYGVRWSLSDYFSYNNLYKQHFTYPNKKKYAENHNYYVLAFNSNKQIGNNKDIFVKIVGTEHTCTRKRISVPTIPEDHYQIQFTPNQTLNSTDTWIYKCFINVNLNQAQDQAVNVGESLFRQYPYTIYMRSYNYPYRTQITSKKTANRLIQQIKTTLFTSSFRCPLPFALQQKSQNKQLKKMKIAQKALVFGDWSDIDIQVQQTKHFIPIKQSLIRKLDEQTDIIIALCLGDLGYDIVGTKYVEILKYIQPISSRIVFVAVPGNHDLIYHRDTFQIFVQTFFSPQWNKYKNSYFTFIFGDVMFMNYSPTDSLYNQMYEVLKSNGDVLQYLQKDIFGHYMDSKAQNNSRPILKTAAGNLDPIQRQYHTIVVSHYPMFCSSFKDSLKTCQQSKTKLSEYLNIFTDMGMDLYLSAHVHYYQRTHELCWDRVKKQAKVEKPTTAYDKQQINAQKLIYSEKCPIYIVEGDAGNSYWVQQDGANAPTQMTGKISERTGFGILSTYTDYYQNISEQTQDFLQYRHYRVNKIGHSQLSDKFTKMLPKLQKSIIMTNQTQTKSQLTPEPVSPQNYKFQDTDIASARVWQMAAISIFVIFISLICFYYGKVYVGSFGTGEPKKKTGHVQMIEQNFEGVVTQIKPSQETESK